MRPRIEEWLPEQRRGRTARATGEQDGSPTWLLTVFPTAGGKYVAIVERHAAPHEFLFEGPYDTQSAAKRWAVDQAKVLIEATDPGLSGGTL